MKVKPGDLILKVHGNAMIDITPAEINADGNVFVPPKAILQNKMLANQQLIPIQVPQGYRYFLATEEQAKAFFIEEIIKTHLLYDLPVAVLQELSDIIKKHA